MQTPLPVAQQARAGTDPLDREAAEQCINTYRSRLEGCELLIVVPAYNEAGTIAHLASVLPQEVLGMKTETVVSVDGASDSTAQAAEEAGLVVCTSPINRGQGAALKLGYTIAVLLNIPYIAIVDADGQWDPSSLSELLAPIRSGEADFTQGSRVLGSTHVGDPIRDLGVTFFAHLVSLLIKRKITDTSSGIRAFRTALLEDIRLSEPQYQSSELLISAAYSGARIVEFPVVLSKRHRGTSKKGNNLKYGANYTRVVLRTWIRERFVFGA